MTTTKKITSDSVRAMMGDTKIDTPQGHILSGIYLTLREMDRVAATLARRIASERRELDRAAERVLAGNAHELNPYGILQGMPQIENLAGQYRALRESVGTMIATANAMGCWTIGTTSMAEVGSAID